MNILTDITSQLINTDKPLTAGLFKLKLLALRLQNMLLLDWINKELKGYEDGTYLPIYRITSGQLKGTFSNGIISREDVGISTIALPETIEDYITNFKIPQNISIVEEYAKKTEDSLKIPISPEWTAIMMDRIVVYNPTIIGYSLTDSYTLISRYAYKNILDYVRNYALDLTTALESNLGYEVEIEKLIQNKDETNQIIQSFMTQGNIINIGDGNLVNTGDKNSISQNINIQKGNFEQLRQTLIQIGLEETDINELENILKEDNADIEKKEFGAKTKSWIKKMVNKFFYAGGQIGFGAIGSILANSISPFLGF